MVSAYSYSNHEQNCICHAVFENDNHIILFCEVYHYDFQETYFDVSDMLSDEISETFSDFISAKKYFDDLIQNLQLN